MKLATPKEFAELCFAETCRPDPRTVRSWVLAGSVAGKVIGRQCYVDLDEFERSQPIPAAHQKTNKADVTEGQGVEVAEIVNRLSAHLN